MNRVNYLESLRLLLGVDPVPDVVLQLRDQRVVRLARPGGLGLRVAPLKRIWEILIRLVDLIQGPIHK